ncbi:MAG: serine/threonine protein kinase [Myxococcales bacterium]|nr:serine/threonine protein kinase [Myxococcales bacterium]
MTSSSAGGSSSNRSEPVVPALDASRFELGEAIGAGGMGTVYRALQRSVGRHVAVKMLAPEHAANASGLARFVREANAIARLNHPNIVQLIDFGRDHSTGNLLLVMELLEGEPLRSTLRREHRLAPDRAVYVAVQCLNALRAAHASGVIHRDLKPENIFIHHVGDDDHVKVLDFGVAKLTQNEVGENTTAGSLVGTLRYMAPEQIAGENPDLRIDVYAMGMVLYEMLAGALPYDTRDRYVLLRSIIADPPRHLLVAAPELDPALAEVVMRAVAKGAAERWQTADDFRRALLPFLGGDQARLQALSESSGRFRQPGSGMFNQGGSVQSGIVRSGSFQGAPGPLGTAAERPSARFAGATGQVGVANSEVIRQAMAQAVPSGPVNPSAPGYGNSFGATSIANPSGSRTPRIILGAVLFLALLVGAAVRILGAPHPVVRESAAAEPDQSGTRVVITPPTVSPAPRAPQAPAVPTAPPVGDAVMVTVNTNPPGARLVDPSNNAELCARTPCGVVVAPTGQPVRAILDEVSLDARLVPALRSVSLDLSSVALANRPHGNTPRPRRQNDEPGHGHNNAANGGGNNGGSDDLPMFLPH